MTMKTIQPVYFTDININDDFWTKRASMHRQNTVPMCLQKCGETGRIDNFKKAAGEKEGEFEGIYFNDSDVYKVLEGIAYSLMLQPDSKLEEKADQIIANIAEAQEDDGYLDTYFTLEEPQKKWTDMEKHEMYCGGHLMEAAVAYKKATGKDKLLNVACKLADHYDSIFGPGKKHWVTGHEEVELGLIKLYRETGKKRYLDLARWLLEERGHGQGRGEIWDKEEWGPIYCQDDKPVKNMIDVKGHAVRAMYLYAAMADVVILNDEEEYSKALDRLYESVVKRNMYITGGIGQTKDNEGFTYDYDLPNDTAYCETCASVGMIYWNWRMNMIHANAKYADIVEKELYNGALAGVSLDGKKFFYDNPLETDGSHHRQEWYNCSCCPTQISRFIPSIGNYIYNKSGNSVWINQFIAGEADLLLENGEVQITQQCNYPWEGSIKFIIDQINIKEVFNVFVRIPGWVNSFSISVNDKKVSNYRLEKGYLKLSRDWKQGDEVLLELDMPVKRMYSDPRVKNNIDKVAIQRGPVVYCFEYVDNSGIYDDISISKDTIFNYEYESELLEGVVKINVLDGDKKYAAIPYYAWDNREKGRMKVWVDEQK